MANAGAAWDNAKKLVETELNMKGTDLHAATVVGDTVGTVTCWRPLCTASVWPMNSGRMVDRRDHVRTTFFSFFSFIAVTFFSR